MEYLLIFLEGIASFISPCILPLVPIYISYFAGENKDKKRAFLNSIAFVLGFSFVYILLAIIVNRFGIMIKGYINSIKIVFGGLIILFGLGYAGLYDIKLFNKFKHFKSDKKNLNFAKSLVFGILFSISITSCVGTFLSSALLMIAGEEKIIVGILLIGMYCLGLGIPFILSSILIEQLKDTFDVIKKHYMLVKIICGIILIVMGVYVLFFY